MLVYAVNAITGMEVWHYHTNSIHGYFYASPVVADGLVFIGGYEQRFYALNAKTGQLKWQRDFPGVFEASPTFCNGTVFASSNQGMFYALDANNGNTVWSQGGIGYGSGFNYGISSSAVKSDIVYKANEYLKRAHQLRWDKTGESGKNGAEEIIKIKNSLKNQHN